ncbi:MAG: lipid-binding SYLF domain-containing protein [Desulfuromonadales bacterium]|nr:lipid-binding SYLF domain-containing protein [Desulfuromonadales bacterium]
MRLMRSTVVAASVAVVFGMSLSNAMAKDEAVKTGTESKAVKVESAKTASAPKLVKDHAGNISNASKVVKEIAAIPKRKIPPVLLNGASAIVIVPKVAKQSLMVSGGSAGGVLLVHDSEGKWSSPVFITISGGTLGWQIVGDPLDIVLVIKSKKSVDAILKGKFTLDAKVAVEPGRLGPTMKGATVKEQKAEIASYVRSHGAFAEEVTTAGSILQIDAAANDAFYAKPKVEAGDIVSGKAVKSTEDVKALQKLLADYAAAK